VILFTKGGCQWLEDMADTGADALGIDWSTDLAAARRRVGDRVALQGNLDPAILLADKKVIRREVNETLNSFGQGNGHVFNLGHGITPEVDPENLAALVSAVRELSPGFHS
jgi:uroporphyrinogen decarboxylase